MNPCEDHSRLRLGRSVFEPSLHPTLLRTRHLAGAARGRGHVKPRSYSFHIVVKLQHPDRKSSVSRHAMQHGALIETGRAGCCSMATLTTTSKLSGEVTIVHCYVELADVSDISPSTSTTQRIIGLSLPPRCLMQNHGIPTSPASSSVPRGEAPSQALAPYRIQPQTSLPGGHDAHNRVTGSDIIITCLDPQRARRNHTAYYADPWKFTAGTMDSLRLETQALTC